MKKSKISLLSIFAIMIALVASSFTSPSPKIKLEEDTFWYKYMGSTQDVEDLQDNTNYDFVDGEPACEGSEDICGVRAEGPTTLGSHPNAFSSGLQDKIEEVATTPTAEYPQEIAQEEQ
jgi:hypothetical protein